MLCESKNETYRQILLVRKDEQEGITQLILVQHALQLFTCFDDTISVVRIDDEDNALGVLEVMSPERSDLVLTTNIPHCELNVLVLNRLNVETCSESISTVDPDMMVDAYRW